MTSVPLLMLNSGVQMPAIGLGVFQTSPAETTSAVEAALSTGYRHIDTAAAYANEREVGEGIRRSGLDRSEVFIETKVWISDYGYDKTLHAFDKSARKLGVDYIDLLILHQPLSTAFELTIEAYKALESLLGDGKVRAIGVSNFKPEHLQALLGRTEVVPAVNQIELHPYFTQQATRAIDAAHGILTQAWSQQGRSAIPKSVRPQRIAENFDVFDFELTAAEFTQIDALDTGVRGGPDPDSITLETFGMPIPEA